MPKRLLIATLIAGVCAVAVAACGGSSASSTSTEAPAASSAAAPASTEAATTAAATTEAATTAAATTAAGSTEDNGGGQGDAAAGKTVFTSNCGGCHTLADAGTTGAVGPNLDQLKPAFDKVKSQVENGGGRDAGVQGDAVRR